MKQILILLFLLFSIKSFSQSLNLDIEIYKTKSSNPSYQLFCDRNLGECDLTGSEIISYNNKLKNLLIEVNQNVNSEILFEFDEVQYGVEEYWSYPESGMGDCEDFALEKRRRLVGHGIDRAALKIATVMHKTKFYMHAILLIETDQGTFVLDQENSNVSLWYETPYVFEAREMVGGSWEYFTQNW